MRIARLAFAAIATLLATACSPPVEPPQQKPPPQATELRDAIQAPIDKARAVEGVVQDAAQIDAATE